MYHYNMDQIIQEVKAKQARFQAEAAQERLAKLSAEVGQTGKVPGQGLRNRSWFQTMRLRLAGQPK